MQQNSLKVCVSGAAGQIAYSFLPILCSGEVFGNNTQIDLRLLDVPIALDSLKGVKLELEDCAFPLITNIEVGSDPNQLFKDLDVAILIGGIPRQPGMERKDLLQLNGQIFVVQGKALNDNAKLACKILVVANPANTNCWILKENAPNIPRQNFTCLTRLDHNRAIAQISLKANVLPSEVKNVIIWGNHSTTQYPDVNHGQISGKEIRQVISDNDYLNKDFIERVQKRGGEILNVRGKSSVFSAAKAVADHLKDWYQGTPEGTWTSMGVVSDGSYGITPGIVFSYPVTCSNFEYKIVQGLHIDDFSQQKFNITLKELEDEKNEGVPQ